MHGPYGKRRARGEQMRLSGFSAFCPLSQKPDHSSFTLPKKPMGENPAAGPGPAAETQHRPLWARRFGFMCPLPSMNLRLFLNISPAPFAPLSGWNLSPNSLLFYPPGFLSQPQTTPFHTCRNAPSKTGTPLLPITHSLHPASSFINICRIPCKKVKLYVKVLHYRYVMGIMGYLGYIELGNVFFLNFCWARFDITFKTFSNEQWSELLLCLEDLWH